MTADTLVEYRLSGILAASFFILMTFACDTSTASDINVKDEACLANRTHSCVLGGLVPIYRKGTAERRTEFTFQSLFLNPKQNASEEPCPVGQSRVQGVLISNGQSHNFWSTTCTAIARLFIDPQPVFVEFMRISDLEIRLSESFATCQNASFVLSESFSNGTESCAAKQPRFSEVLTEIQGLRKDIAELIKSVLDRRFPASPPPAGSIDKRN